MYGLVRLSLVQWLFYQYSIWHCRIVSAFRELLSQAERDEGWKMNGVYLLVRSVPSVGTQVGV